LPQGVPPPTGAEFLAQRSALEKEEGDSWTSDYHHNCGKPDRICSNVLFFETWQDYQNMYDCLQSNYETWCDDFETTHETLNDDDYNAYVEANDWNEDVPLMSWENDIPQYVSLRKSIYYQMQTWLENNPLDYPNCPDNHAIADEIQRTLVNSQGNIAIEDKIYHYEPAGGVYIIPINDCACLEQVNLNIGYPENFPSCVTSMKLKTGPAGCNGDYNKDVWANDNSDGQTECGNTSKTYNWRLHFFYGESNGQAATFAEIINSTYKKKNNGNWKKWRTKQKVTLAITPFIDLNGVCTARTPYLDDKTKRRKRVMLGKVWPAEELYWHNDYFSGSYEVYDLGEGCNHLHIATE
jgi:hypothetical protein